jgi:hypothetical protein
MGIVRLRVAGDPAKAPKCGRCGKLLVAADRDTDPLCRICHTAKRIEDAVDGLLKNSMQGGENHERKI